MDKKVTNLTNKNNKSNTEEFIVKARLKHGDKYDYSKTEYVASRVKIKIICPIHGEFEQTPESHLKPMGCFKCGYIDYNRAKRHTKDSFIERANEIHYDFYDYSKINYIDFNTEVEIICPKHGVFLQKPKNHLKRGCRECTINKLAYNKKETIEKLIVECENSYNKDISKSFRLNIFVDLICEKHGLVQGEIRQDLYNIKCPICHKKETKKRKFTKDSFIRLLYEIHNDTLDFSKTEYIKSNKKVKYICKIHGEKEALPSNLLKGHGCSRCNFDKQKENPGSWSYSSWEKKAKLSNYFDSFKVYIIRCWNDEEEFYKIGRTYVTVNRRFASKFDMPYNYEIIHVIEDENVKTICNMESKLKIKILIMYLI